MSFEEIQFCDEFRPTLEEMKDFQGYLTNCESVATSGIIKVSNNLYSRLFLLLAGKLE